MKKVTIEIKDNPNAPAPPEYIKKIYDVLREGDIKDDEFVIMVSGKKSGRGGIDMNSAWCINHLDFNDLAKMFFSELMMTEMKLNLKGRLIMPFLLRAHEIYLEIKNNSESRGGRRTAHTAGRKDN